MRARLFIFALVALIAMFALMLFLNRILSPVPLVDQIDEVVFGDALEVDIQLNQILVIWNYHQQPFFEQLEDEMGEVICYLRDNVDNNLTYQLVIKIDVVDDLGNKSSTNGLSGLFDPSDYRELNCNDTNYTSFDLREVSRTLFIGWVE